jgi:hypothetical protein
VNVGFEWLDARDCTSALDPRGPCPPPETAARAATADVHGKGYSIWAIPKSPNGWEGLLRYDHHTPNASSAFAPGTTAPNPLTPLDEQRQDRVIVGVAYWFPHQGSVSSALLFDYDGQRFSNITTAPTRSVAVHALINF